MTRLPTETSIRHLLDSLRTLNRVPKGGRNRTELDLLEARLIHAIERDRTGSAIPDGYPTTTLGGGGAALTADGHPDPLGRLIADQLAGSRTPRDTHHELTAKAAQAIEDAVVNLNIAHAALASIDDLTRTSGPSQRTCTHCTPHLPTGNARPVHRRGTVGDRLTAAIDLCEPCYFFAQRSADAGTHAGQLPTPEQIAHHDRTGTWRIRVA